MERTMALTNAERQAIWRDRRNRLAKQALAKDRQIAELKAQLQEAQAQLREAQAKRSEPPPQQHPLRNDDTAVTAEEEAVDEALRKPASMILVDGPAPLADKLIRLIIDLLVQGKASMATASPPSVLCLAVLLDRVLVKHKIIPPGDRMKYARALKRKERQEHKAKYGY
jgi:hypothetical protein